uniref:Uncharacterized protein n=1 Tax=mine drainage metagenome TaxID=410659 RepID=E6Q2T9_9ZZZZ
MRRLIAVCAALFFVYALVVPIHPELARETQLVAYSETPASDGSVQFILDFDGFAPSSQVVHAKRDDVCCSSGTCMAPNKLVQCTF